MADYNVPDYAVARLRYFNGQFLKEQDFIDEQKFHLSQAWRHQRLLHVSGVAAGLDVSVVNNGASIRVAAGSAVDDAGRQILLAAAQTIAVPPGSGPWVVELAFAEQATNVADVNSPVQDFTRWSQNASPVAITSTLSPGAVLLAELVIAAGTITVKRDKRKYSGVRLPDAGGGGIALRSRGDAAAGWGQLEGSLSVQGALATAGDVTAAGALSVTGALTAAGGLSVTGGNVGIANNLSVGGTTTFTGVVSASGGINGAGNTLSVTNNLSVVGTSTFTGVVNANGGINGPSNTLNVTSNLNVVSASTFNGAVTAKNGLTVTAGNLSVAGTSMLTGAVTASGGLNASAATITGVTNANGGLNASWATITGVTNANGGLNASSATITGVTNANGGLNAPWATITGVTNANGGLNAPWATITGVTNASGGLNAPWATITGVTNASGGLNAPWATMTGVTNANGGLNASWGTFTGPVNANAGINGPNNTLTVNGGLSVNGNVGIGIWPPRSRLDLGPGGLGNSLRIGSYFDIGGTYLSNFAYIGVNAVLSTSDGTNGNRFKPVHWGPSPPGGGMVMNQIGGGYGDLDFWGINWNNDPAEKAFPGAFTHVMRLGINGNVGIGTGGAAPGAKLDVNGSLRVATDAQINGSAYVTGIVQAQTIRFPGQPGDPPHVITSRTMPTNQGGSNERTELILFATNDPANGAGPDTITLRAPHIRLQTYNNVYVGDIDNPDGSVDRLTIDPLGKIQSPMWKVTQVMYMEKGALPLARSFTTSGGTVLLFMSGSGWGQANTTIGIDIWVDDVLRGSAFSYTNLANCHLTITVCSLVLAGLPSGAHTIRLTVRAGTWTDFNDYFTVTVMELPF